MAWQLQPYLMFLVSAAFSAAAVGSVCRRRNTPGSTVLYAAHVGSGVVIGG